jgi:hypothetical protein
LLASIESLLLVGGSPEGAIFIVGLGAVGGFVTGTILLVIRMVLVVPQAVREVRAEAREEARLRKLAKSGVEPGDVPPTTGDVPPITPTSDI